MSVPQNLFDKLNTPMNIITEDPRIEFTQGGAGVAIQHGAHILYAVPDQDNYLTLVINNLSDYQRTGRFETLNTWTRLSPKDQGPSSLRNAFKVERALSITSLGDYVYVFWRAADGEHRALRANPDFLSQFEVATIEFSDIDGALTSNLAGFALPGVLPTLAGRLGVVGLMKASGSSNTVMMARVLEPAEFTPRSRWLARDLSQGAIVTLGSDSNPPKYNQLSASWMDQGPLLVEGAEAPRPSASLIIHLHNTEEKTPSILSYGMDLAATFDGAYRRGTAGASIDLQAIPGLEHAGSLGASFYNAPDGQLWTQYTKDRKTLAAKLALDPGGTRQPGMHSPRWVPTDPFPGQSSRAKAYNTPFTLFLPLMPTVGPSPCKVPPPRDSNGNTGPSQIYENSEVQAFVACVLSADEHHLPLMSTFLWGQTFRIPNYIVSNLVPEKEGVVQLTLVADTFPVPVPSSEVWGEDSPSGMVNWALASYEYLVSEDASVELDYEVSSAFGYKTSGNLMVMGVGLQYELSHVDGFATLASRGQQTLRASSLTVSTKGTPPTLAAQPDNQHLNIAPDGAYFGMTPPTRLGADAYLVLPRGSSAPGEVAMLGVHPDLSDRAIVSRNGSYRTYCYTPGNLLTYDVAAINLRMKAQFDALSPAEQQRFVIDGEDFRPFYSEGDYVNRIAERFGTHGFGPSGGRPYLEFSFSETSIGRSEFQETSSFTEGASNFIDGSWYTGWGWDQTFSTSLGAIVIEISANVFGSSGFAMFGSEFSSSLTTRNRAGSSWGLRLGEFLNPLGPDENYTARLYLLKPSRLWSVEMAVFGGAGPEVDAINSAPVRILFTVPYVSEALRQRLSALPT